MKPNKFQFDFLPEDGIGSDALHCVSSWCPNKEITPCKFGNGQLSLDLIVVAMGALQFHCSLLDGGVLATKSLVICGCLSLLSSCVRAFDLKSPPDSQLSLSDQGYRQGMDLHHRLPAHKLLLQLSVHATPCVMHRLGECLPHVFFPITVKQHLGICD